MNEAIQPGGALAALQAPAERREQGEGELGQQDFLRLMTAQLTAQDPFNPMESGQFLTQFAQFGTVNGIEELKTSFDGLSASLKSLQALQASTLVGRQVLVDAETAPLGADQPVTGQVAAGGAGNVTVSFHDASGELVRSQRLDTDANGNAAFTWDGTRDDGGTAAPGNYRLSAQGTVDGAAVALPTQVQTAVDSVTLGQAGLGLTLNLAGLGNIAADRILEIR